MPVTATCPHCSTPHDVPDVLSQADHVARLKAKSDEIGVLKTTLSEAQIKAGSYDAVAAERDKFRTELTQTREAAARAAIFGEHKISEDAKVRGLFELVYQSEVASAEEGKAPTFGDWFASDTTKAHPGLAPHFGQPAAAPPPVAPVVPPAVQPPTVRPAGPIAGTEAGSAPAADRRQFQTPEDVRTYFNSPGFRALPPDKQREIEADIKAQVSQHRPA